MSKKKKERTWKTKYRLVQEEEKPGGNADVYFVKKTYENDDTVYALKEQRNLSEEKKIRFKNEIKIVVDHQDSVDGIIPILDCDKEDYWYVMPKATLLLEYLDKLNLNGLEKVKKIVELSLQLAQTLKYFHDKGISHRDIKPSNIYYYNDRASFGDFGLVDFPENMNDLTNSEKGLGAIFTIAPEMKRNPKVADGKKADVFSLAKTLWMFLTRDEKGFDGVYDIMDEFTSIRIVGKYDNIHLVEIEELIRDCTNNDPLERPAITEFISRLQEWERVALDFELSQKSDWNFLKKYIFGKYTPQTSVWTDVNEILEVLNVLKFTPAYNHMLFSDGGGLDFYQALPAVEDNCIVIKTKPWGENVLKPEKLVYENFDDYTWNYFLLECGELKPILSEVNEYEYETLCEDIPGHYTDPSCFDYGVYDYESGKKLPASAKLIRRYNRGKMLFLLKTGPYNSIIRTYDGRHGEVSYAEFRKYVDKLKTLFNRDVAYLVEHGKTVDEAKEIVSHDEIINKNPFKKEQMKIDNSSKTFTKIDALEMLKKVFDEKTKINMPICNKKDDSFQKYYFYLDFGNYELFNNKRCYICSDGTFKKNIDESKLFFCYDLDETKKVNEMLSKELLKIIACDDVVQIFDTGMLMNKEPINFFTKEDVEAEMRNADDRKHNVLMVDGDGSVKIIEDSLLKFLYPVRLEHFDAYGNYVGKYSKLNTLDENYNQLLYGWSIYLKNKMPVHIDYLPDDFDEKKTMEIINEFYKKD